jgi:hypothetical protein
MEKKERIKDFNQCFTTIWNKFPINSQPTEGVVVEYYTFSLHAYITMCIKRTSKNRLVENFEEAKKVEKKILNLVGNPVGEHSKTMIVDNKPLLLTKSA